MNDPACRGRRTAASRRAARRYGLFGRRAATVLAWLALTGVTACDPCAGVSGCATAPHLSYSGRLIVHETRQPAPGATVTLHRTSGVELEQNDPSATTDANGFYRLVTGARGAGTVTADITISAPGYATYTVTGLTLRTSEVRGDGGDLGRWVVDPYIAFLGELTSRVTRAKLQGASVTFTRTGGVAIRPAVPSGVSDAGGRFFIGAHTSALGVVTGDLLVTAPSLRMPYRISGIPIAIQYRDEPVQFTAAFSVGPSLAYALELFYRGTESLTRVAGASVQVRRVGGVQTASDTVSATTLANGRFTVELAPLEEGEVVVDVLVRPPAPEVPYTIRGVRLRTFDGDSTRFAGVFGVGYQIAYAGEARQRGTLGLASNVVAEFRRTGGVAITPPVLTARTATDGRFPLIARAAGPGDVVGDLVLRPGGAAPPTVIPGLRLTARDSDEQPFIGVLQVGLALQYQGELYYRSTGERAANVDVEFRRTGGVTITPEVIRERTTAGGRFGIHAAAAEPGDVIGDLVIRPPAPLPGDTVRGIRLATTTRDTDSLFALIQFGPSLKYVGHVIDLTTREGVPGSLVEFRRIRGIRLLQDTMRIVTDRSGRFPFQLLPLEPGEVVGEVIVTPPPPYRPARNPDVHMVTFTTDEQRFLGVFPVTKP